MIKTALITLKRAGYIPKGTTNSQEEGYQVVDISHTFVKEQNAVGDGTGIMYAVNHVLKNHAPVKRVVVRLIALSRGTG